MPYGSFTLSASGAATVLHAASHFIPLLGVDERCHQPYGRIGEVQSAAVQEPFAH
jgi:hypothetical protein